MSTEKLKRRLAAILALDVVGFSRLMHADEIAAFALVKELTDTVFAPAIEDAGGAIFKHTGDGILARFDSVHDAFEAGEAIIAAVIASGRAAVRIGIHLGDVIDSEGDTFGDSVNIACRLESIALQNGICVSERAWSDLRQRNVPFHDLGVQQLKNIETPIRVYMYDSSNGPPPRAKPSAARPRKQLAALAAGIAVLALGGLAAWQWWPAVSDRTGGQEAAVNAALATVPCSWLRLAKLDESASRSAAVVEGYSSTSSGRLRQLLMGQLAGRVSASLSLDTSAVSPIPDYNCSFLEEASRLKYEGLSRAELVTVLPNDSAEYRTRYAAKVPANVRMIYDVRIFTRDFSPNAQLFAIDEADGLQHLRPISRITTRYPEEAQVPGGVVHALVWTDQESPGLFFIVDSSRPIDVRQVQQDLSTMEGLARFREAAEAGGWQFELVLLKQAEPAR